MCLKRISWRTIAYIIVVNNQTHSTEKLQNSITYLPLSPSSSPKYCNLFMFWEPPIINKAEKIVAIFQCSPDYLRKNVRQIIWANNNTYYKAKTCGYTWGYIGSVNIRNQIRKQVICILPNQKYGGYPWAHIWCIEIRRTTSRS